jgi:ribosome maturation protein SDO1
VFERMKQIVNEIAMTATDPRTKLPHPHVRIENALDEARFKADPFLSIERQVQDAVDILKPIIPLRRMPRNHHSTTHPSALSHEEAG